MKNPAGLVIFFALLFAAAPMPALAKTPKPNIETLYAKYKAALGDTDYTNAYYLAEKVWKASESTYGDSRPTGDFAYNFAVLGKAYTKSKVNKSVEKAFARSIELAHFHNEKAPQVELKRYLYFAAYMLQTGKVKPARALLKKGETMAKNTGLLATKDYALLVSHQAQIAYTAKRYRRAKTYIAVTQKILNDLGKHSTKDAYQAEYIKANANAKLGNWREALVGYEKIYLNKARELDMQNRLIGQAYVKKLETMWRAKSQNDLTSEDIRAALSCPGCWPNISAQYIAKVNEDDKLLRIERKPPKFPRRARTSAFVVIMYDIDGAGIPANFRLIGGSHANTFDAATIAALKRWRVYERETDALAINQKDLMATITFVLSYRKGQNLDFYGDLIKD